MAQYGLGGIPEYTDANSWVFKRWLNAVNQWVTSRIGLVTKTSNYSVESLVFYVRVDATAAAITITIPAALNLQGRQILVKKIDASAHAVTVQRSGTDTFEGSTSIALAAQWAKTLLISNGNDGWEKLI